MACAREGSAATPAAYRVLALDMDGTLLSSTKQVLPRTAHALAGLAARGVAIVFSTGRNTAEVETYRADLPFIRYGVLVSGGLVYDFERAEALASRPLDTDLALRAIDEGMANGAMLHVLTVRRSVAREQDIARLDELGLGVYRSLFEEVCTRVDDPRAYVAAHDGRVIKVNLYHPSQEARARTEAALAGLPLALVHGESGSLECTVSGISKAEGLRVLVRHVGCTMDEVVMVGDSENDREALGAVGMPVAMGNAEPQIAALARLVVADCDHDGVAEAVAQLFG